MGTDQLKEWNEDNSGNLVPTEGEDVGDGTTTADHKKLDGALGRFARINANLSWEYDMLADVLNWETGSNGVSSWTFTLNSRPRRIHVEHDGSAGSDTDGGVIGTVLTTFESLGEFRITFVDVSYRNNNDDNALMLGFGDHSDPATAPNNATNAVYLGTGNTDRLINSGSGNSNPPTGGTSWSSNHDISIEYDGSEVRLYEDGSQIASQSYSANADFSPFIQLEDDGSNVTGETVECEQITVEPL